MRKGTRSCRECMSRLVHTSRCLLTPLKGRRRKIKCTWPVAATDQCTECSQNKRPCQKQGKTIQLPAGQKSKIDVSRVEPIVESMTSLQQYQLKRETLQDQSRMHQLQSQLLDLDDLDEPSTESSPLWGLFNNQLVRLLHPTMNAFKIHFLAFRGVYS
jgi:hypothetical protein